MMRQARPVAAVLQQRHGSSLIQRQPQPEPRGRARLRRRHSTGIMIVKQAGSTPPFLSGSRTLSQAQSTSRPSHVTGQGRRLVGYVNGSFITQADTGRACRCQCQCQQRNTPGRSYPLWQLQRPNGFGIRAGKQWHCIVTVTVARTAAPRRVRGGHWHWESGSVNDHFVEIIVMPVIVIVIAIVTAPRASASRPSESPQRSPS